MSVMTSPLVCAVAGFYILWLVITVINQFNNASNYLGAYGGRALAAVNSLLVIPRWTFFAPQPGVHDFHLLYRTENLAGEKSAFQEVPIRSTHRNISAAVWNHRKRVPKIIFDLALIMGSQVQEYKKNKYNLSLLKISFHYLLLLHIVSTYCRAQVGSNVQFIIVRTEGHICVEEPELVFISDFHRLSAC